MKRERIYWHLIGISQCLAVNAGLRHGEWDALAQTNNPNKQYKFTTARFKQKRSIIGPSPLFAFPAQVRFQHRKAGINSPERRCFILSYIKIRTECLSPSLSASVYLQMRAFNLNEWPNSEVVSKT